MSPVLHRLLLALLAASILGAQMLGFMHRALHGGGDTRPHLEEHHGHAGSTTQLFGDHEDASECRLFDGVAHGSPLPATPVVLPLIPSCHFVVHAQGEALARWAALFQARGPPASS